MRKLVVMCMLALGATGTGWSQEIPLGSWRTHLSYTNVSEVAASDARIYGSVPGGIIEVDLEDNSVYRITELDGLQGGGISALAYAGSEEVLLVGYGSGNLDLVFSSRIVNLDLVRDSQVIGSKKINDILVQGEFAYLATDFGVLKFHIGQAEVRDTYREIGPEGSQIQVSGLAVFEDSLFVTYPEGIRAGDLRSVNLADWRLWVDRPLTEGPERAAAIASVDGRLFASADGIGLFHYDGSWELTSVPAAAEYRELRGNPDGLIIVTESKVEVRNPVDLSVVDEVESASLHSPQDAYYDPQGAWWIADQTSGLVSDQTGQLVSYSPSGPSSSNDFNLVGTGDSLYVLTGGYSGLIQPLERYEGVHIFSNGQWENRFAGGTFGDLTDVAVMPVRGDRYYASAGDGILQAGTSGTTVIDENSPGSPLVNPSSPQRGLIIPSLASDNSGLWVLNYGVATSLHFLDPDGNWTSYEVPVSPGRYAVEVLPAGDLVWLRIAASRGGGLVVFDPGTGMARFLNMTPGNGSLPSMQVNDMEMDRNGFLWLGTNTGVSIITNPFTMQGEINAVEPIFDGRPLLIDEEVTVIKSDGGNRKWMGTGNGAWLFDGSADDLLLRFTRENSPLPANRIQSIGILDVTGEVFFGTGQGLVSYRSDATTGGAEHQSVRIFPNPVRADFQGVVGISGLVSDAEVKITDSAGRLVYRTRANGGTASWPIDGEQLQSGVYMVFSATPDGSETFVGKIAIIR